LQAAGFDYDFDVLRKYRTGSYRFPHGSREPAVSHKVHLMCGSPAMLRAVRAGCRPGEALTVKRCQELLQAIDQHRHGDPNVPSPDIMPIVRYVHTIRVAAAEASRTARQVRDLLAQPLAARLSDADRDVLAAVIDDAAEIWRQLRVKAHQRRGDHLHVVGGGAAAAEPDEAG
jgi:hypothetical protein